MRTISNLAGLFFTLLRIYIISKVGDVFIVLIGVLANSTRYRFPPPTQFLRCCQRGSIGTRPIRARVPQENCLSPSLIATYTDDIPTLRGHLEDWEDDVMLAMYANNSVYFASSQRADLAAGKIQRVFDVLPDWLDKWRMAVNVSRTTAVLTGSQRIIPVQLRLRGSGCGVENLRSISGRQ
ncbi:RNA-directed DNA polymerase from mobile element jockey [Eumeta japonica]|uniref:RNA-directed DNA polymerase from mobile element jockey n=1 Tax=Eumeta variegata TaxID=151549 RepID=A0A4C1WAN8_EUMVA|nr:RNA-directed DNA polymerase from mobile element jockey [Eumeta japonica]